MQKATLIRLAERVFNSPLMILPDKLSTILSVIGERIGVDESIQLISTEFSSGEPDQIDSLDGVSIIPVHGSLVNRTMGLSPESGLTSYDDIRSQFNEALASDSKAIIFDINSPGGEAHGVMDLSDEIYEARGEKPIYAIANEAAFSAAYAIASAADQIFLPRSAGVGSVGVIAVHRDQSKFDTDLGLKYTPVYAGARKTDLDPHQPLSDKAKSFLQEEVDYHYQMFVDAVARNRGLSASKVKGTEAGLFTGDKAVAIGLADEVRPFKTSIRQIAADIGKIKSLVPVMSYTHNSRTKDGEPEWGNYISNNRKELPDSAFADMKNRKYPHHWISGGAMYLHRGGLSAARSRAGQHDPEGGVTSHLDAHAKAIGMGEYSRKEERTMDYDELKAEHPELFQKIVDEATKELKTKLETAETTLAQERDGFSKEREGFQEKLASLEKAEAIRREKELKFDANAIWHKSLADSEIPDRLYEKVMNQVSYQKFVSDGALDEAAFKEAVEAEVADWEGRGVTSNVMGLGVSVKGDESVERKEKLEEEADEKLADELYGKARGINDGKEVS